MTPGHMVYTYITEIETDFLEFCFINIIINYNSAVNNAENI